MCQTEDEERGGEVLEPRPARGERVPEEVRAEVPAADEPEDRARPDRRLGALIPPDRLRYAAPALCSAS